MPKVTDSVLGQVSSTPLDHPVFLTPNCIKSVCMQYDLCRLSISCADCSCGFRESEWRRRGASHVQHVQHVSVGDAAAEITAGKYPNRCRAAESEEGDQ